MNEIIRETALQTIRSEAESVAALSEYINSDFEKAVEAVLHCKGRFVLSGIGKSAIIAQKIAATLNSTGTPALFMHTGDAVHGDIGMVQKDDVVMIISKSGESSEIKVLIPLLKNLSNVLIGMGGNVKSFLAANSNFFLNTTVKEEACSNNLAPTNSATAQMVMGDALAVCLMKLKGFKGEDFARFHPGGNLGKRLYLKVRDVYMADAKPAVAADAGLKEIIVEITKHRLGATAVIAENRVVGIITDGDLRRMLETTNNLENIKAADIATPNPKTVMAEDLAVYALEVLRSNDISQLIVNNKNHVYSGMLHLHDLIKEGIV